MENKRYYNIKLLEEDDSRIIIDKRWYHSETIEPNFDKCDSKETINNIKKQAAINYKTLTTKEDNKCLILIDSAIVKTNYYNVTFNTVDRVKEDGTVIYESVDAVDYDYEYNPYYYERLSKELNKLAKKDNLYLDISLKMVDSFSSYVMEISTLTKEQFEDTYNISLDEYYDALSEKTTHSNTKRELEFKQSIAKFKKSYIINLIGDINKGFDSSDVEMFGYMSYLKIRYDFRDLSNKDEILKEFGFVIDNDNYLIKLPYNKEYQPVLNKKN